METPAASKRSSQRTAFVNVSFVLCAKCGPPRFYIIFFFFFGRIERRRIVGENRFDSRDVGDKWNWKREILIIESSRGQRNLHLYAIKIYI